MDVRVQSKSLRFVHYIAVCSENGKLSIAESWLSNFSTQRHHIEPPVPSSLTRWSWATLELSTTDEQTLCFQIKPKEVNMRSESQRTANPDFGHRRTLVFTPLAKLLWLVMSAFFIEIRTPPHHSYSNIEQPSRVPLCISFLLLFQSSQPNPKQEI